MLYIKSLLVLIKHLRNDLLLAISFAVLISKSNISFYQVRPSLSWSAWWSPLFLDPTFQAKQKMFYLQIC